MDHKKLMGAWQSGDRDAGDRLLSEIEGDLRRIAAAQLLHERGSSLSTGDLVNDAVIRLSSLKQMDFQSRAHILALAARIMRQVLIDHARRRDSNKRQHAQVTLTTDVGIWERPIELISLELAMQDLHELDPQRADIVEMRFFGGMSISDIALVLGLSEPTVKRRWASTRAWLHNRLKG